MKQKQREEAHKANRTRFVILLAILEVIVVILYGIFVRVQDQNDATLNPAYYPMFQDVNVMMLIGFGFLMTFIKRHSWSALSYTFFINAIIIQLYPLLQGFWHRVLKNHWQDNFFIQIQEKSFTAASYSVASILIAFGAVLGKVGPLELLIMGIFGIVGYTLNQQIVYFLLGINDVGGSTAIHTFGAYFGLTVCFILGKKVYVKKKAQTTVFNSTFAMIGTFFLWMFWPSFNAGIFPENAFQKSLIISNTIIALTGSCLATFITSGLIHEKFSIEDILNATLAGGVAIGAPSGVVANPGIALTIGIIAGAISTLCFSKLSQALYKNIGLHDTCGVHNLHGIPGLIGAWASAIVIASYQTSPGLDVKYQQYVNFTPMNRSFSGQAGIQVAGSFVSLGISIVTGVLAGALLYFLYDFKNEQFFEDDRYFEVPQQQYVPNILDASSIVLNRDKVKLRATNTSNTKKTVINTQINLDQSQIK